jgi:hypothetical protein
VLFSTLILLLAAGAFAAVPVLKITVTESGEILVNRKASSLEALPRLLDRLKEAGGVVWYHREKPTSRTPSENADKVMSLIVKAQLPVRLALDPEFTEFVDPDGAVRPR